MCCFKSRIAKILIVVFSVLSVCGGLAMIALTWYFMTDKGFNSDGGIKNGTQKIAIITGMGKASGAVFGAVLGGEQAQIIKSNLKND